MTQTGMKSPLIDAMNLWEVEQEELIFINAQLHKRERKSGVEIDLVYPEDIDVYGYTPDWFNDVFVEFGNLNVDWTLWVHETFRPIFRVVSVMEQAPHEGVCCFTFDNVVDAYRAKLMMNVYK